MIIATVMICLPRRNKPLAKTNSPLPQRRLLSFSKPCSRIFDAEEKTLFPAFESATGMSMGPTQVMRMEREEQIRALMTDAVAALQER